MKANQIMKSLNSRYLDSTKITALADADYYRTYAIKDIEVDNFDGHRAIIFVINEEESAMDQGIYDRPFFMEPYMMAVDKVSSLIFGKERDYEVESKTLGDVRVLLEESNMDPSDVDLFLRIEDDMAIPVTCVMYDAYGRMVLEGLYE